MPRSFIDPEYRSNIIFAIYDYKMMKPDMRVEDINQCLLIAQAEYRHHHMLRSVLTTYLNMMPTGFNLLGLKSLPVRTGHSTLRSLVLAALDSKPDEDLLAYELMVEEEIKKSDSGLSREDLLIENTQLLSEMIPLKQKLQYTQDKMNEWMIECKTTQESNKRIEKKLVEAIWRGDKLAVENREVNHHLLEAVEENKKLRLALERKGFGSGPEFFPKPNLVTTPL